LIATTWCGPFRWNELKLEEKRGKAIDRLRKADMFGHVVVIRSMHGRLLALFATAAMFAACGETTVNAPPEHIAATVNGTPITAAELDAAMPQLPTGSPDASTATSAAILQQLIETELLVQKARATKVDRDPQVMLAMQDVRRAVLANEWLRRAVADAPAPSEQEVKNYFLEHAELFSGRRAFTFRLAEVQAPASDARGLQEQLAKTKNLDIVLDHLRVGNRPFTVDLLSKNSEQLPANLLHRLQELKDGDLAAFSVGDRVDLVQMLEARVAPIDESEARQLIEKTLVAQRTTERAEAAVSSLRAAAKIEMVGDFKDQVASGPAVSPTGPTAEQAGSHLAEGLK
jgi:EpsD family peptidyl-prolyl cis-trans isomerase